MHVLAGWLDLHVPHSRSLKEKRGVVLRLRSQIRKSFEISCSEVGHQDLLQRSLLGVAAVGPDRPPLERLSEKILDLVEENLDGELLAHDFEILDYGRPGQPE